MDKRTYIKTPYAKIATTYSAVAWWVNGKIISKPGIKIKITALILARLSGRTYKGLMYADPITHSGVDEDATFDDDDELVFMVRFLGDKKEPDTNRPASTSAVK